jgi:hypothetical protein
MAKRHYYNVPKNIGEMTEEELEALASVVYENMMAKFANDHSGFSAESSES